MKERIGRPGTRQVLVPLQPGRGGMGAPPRIERREGLTCIEIDVAQPFGPLGLALWGCNEETFVHDLRCSNWVEGLASSGRIPGRYFSVQKSFDELLELARIGELQQAIRAEQLLEMHEVPPSGRIGVAIEGRFTEGCFWGLTYAEGGPRLSAKLARTYPAAESGGPTQPPRVLWQGSLIQHRLLSDEIVGQVETESESTAIQLLEIVTRSWRGR